ncbi:GIY-YIG nuclease family protein [Synechococcus sp. AH-224-I15]|nr:GIY-YIG nuclease family protein [Synechococcus sp. AH-224-I15]
MQASCFHPDEFQSPLGVLDMVSGVYVILGNDCTEAFYVGQSVDLRRRLRTHFAWISPGDRQTAINKISGGREMLRKWLFEDHLSPREARQKVAPIHDECRSGLRAAVISHPDIPLDCLESDLILWLRPRFNGQPPLPGWLHQLDELEGRVSPYLSMLEGALS